MRNQIAKGLAALGAMAAIAIGGAGIAQASGGADDPAGHVRHGHALDDRGTHKRDDRRGHHHRHHRARGGDDRPGDDRGRGRDDGPNHG